MNLTTREFKILMDTVSEGWNEGNAHKAAECFSENAIYLEPPDAQLYHGRAELYEFFGGASGSEIPMHMTWHHLAFNEQDQVGFGEYTFEMHNRYHGIVVVKLENGLIQHWCEYQYRTELNWHDFTSRNSF